MLNIFVCHASDNWNPISFFFFFFRYKSKKSISVVQILLEKKIGTHNLAGNNFIQKADQQIQSIKGFLVQRSIFSADCNQVRHGGGGVYPRVDRNVLCVHFVKCLQNPSDITEIFHEPRSSFM